MNIQKHFGKENFSKETIAEYNSRGSGFSLTLDGLKKLVTSCEAANIPGDTLVCVEQLEDELFDKEKNNGWNVIDFLWDSYVPINDPDVTHESYSSCVPAFNAFVTKDTNGDKLIIITPHY